jgi:hypothetical protein
MKPMSADDARTAARQFDDFIKLEWQDIFRKEVHVKLDNGARYVPNSGSQGVQLLRKSVNAFDEAVRIWSGATDDPDSGTQGYDRIVEQAASSTPGSGVLSIRVGRGRVRCQRSSGSASRLTWRDAIAMPSPARRLARKRLSA